MSVHRYPPAKLALDYLRGGAGLLIGGGAWSLVPLFSWPSAIFGGLTGLFLLFTIRTALRHRERVELADEAISVSGVQGGRLERHEIDAIGLRYYAMRRNRGGGWMTLTMRAGRRSLSLDSALDGFEAVARWAARAARENGVVLDSAAVANFAAMDIDLGEPRASWRDIEASPAEAPR